MILMPREYCLFFIGTATRLLEYAVEGRKNYRAELKFGIKTDTGDDSGTIIASSEVRVVTEAEIQETLQKFIGEQKQIPPMYSAIKKDGQKLYQLARQGIEVEREARSITIDALELLHKTGTSLTLDIVCSKGTYVRTLLEDIAAELGMCGTMSFFITQTGRRFLPVRGQNSGRNCRCTVCLSASCRSSSAGFTGTGFDR